MGDIYDIFSKKKVKEPRSPSYHQRNKECLKKIAATGKCECQMCKDKARLANRMFDLLRYLCKDYTEKTGRELYVADALEIALFVVAKMKNELSKK